MTAKNNVTSFLLALLTIFICSWSHAEDVILDIGNGSAQAGSQSGSVTLALDNSADTVSGVYVYICDEGNYLSVKNCVAAGRAANFFCNFNECRTDANIAACRNFPGCAIISIYAIGDTIAAGKGPIADIFYKVSDNTPSGCISLNPKSAKVGRPKIQGVLNQRELSVMAERGEFCISGGSSDDEDTSNRDTNPITPENTRAESPAEPTGSNNSTASAGGGAPAASAQSGFRTPMGGLSGSSQETSAGNDEDSFSTAGSSSRNRTTGSRSSVSSGAADARATGAAGATIAGSGSEESRLVISPSLSVISSKEMLALDAQTIADGQAVRGKYKWEIQPPSTIGSTIDADGIFTAGINTSPSPVQETIRVTDTSNKSISSTATITIEGIKEPPEGCTLTVTPSSAEIAPGHVITFTAKKLGEACAEGTYQWKVSSKIGSTITDDGVYTAGVNRGNAAALDIILVKDSEANLSIDALVTVAPGDEFAQAAASIPRTADGRPGKAGSPLLSGTLLAAAAFAVVIGVLLVRKKK